MKKFFSLIAVFFLIPAVLSAGKDPKIEDVKKKYKTIMGKSKLFVLKSATYDKNPADNGAINIYNTILKVKGKKGKGIFTFVQYPPPDSKSKNPLEIKPVYRNLTLQVLDPGRKDVDPEYTIALHMKEDQTLAVYRGQKLILSWLGDGKWGEKGYHFYSYSEKMPN